MQAYPGRFPNEIMDSLDIALHARIMAAQSVVNVEDKRRAFLQRGVDPGDDWLRIREHDKLVDDYTVQVTDGRS